VAKRKVKLIAQNEEQKIPQDLFEISEEIEMIAKNLRTSTVTYHRAQLLSIVERLREKLEPKKA